LEVLSFAHQHHIVHRNIKPSNLMRRDADKRIMLIDFGATKQICQSAFDDNIQEMNSGYTPAGQIAGDPQSSFLYSRSSL